jgi:hypothetical protein
MPRHILGEKGPSARAGRRAALHVRFEDGLSTGEEKDVPSQSIYLLPGSQAPQRPKARKQQPAPAREAPPGWIPSLGEVVTWTQTLDLRLRVISVDAKRGVAAVGGKEIFGVEEEFAGSA